MNNSNKNIKDKINDVLKDVKDDSSKYSKDEIESGRSLSILCYLGILVLIPYFTEKKNNYVLYHVKQGFNLLLIELICFAVLELSVRIIWFLGGLVSIFATLLCLFYFGLSIAGIIYAYDGKAKELPVINKIKIIK